MLAKLIGQSLYFPPEGVDEGELIADGYKEYEQNDPPEHLQKTQQAVCKLEDTGNKIVMSWDIIPAQPNPAEAMQEIQIQNILSQVAQSEDKTLGIKCMALLQMYVQEKQHEAGEVALHPDTGYPKECMKNYDGAIQTDWTIDTASLWKPWHSTDPDYALPFEHPTGAHDIYKAGEYMIWTDGDIKKCIQDTSYSPDEYAQAWESV